MFGTIAFLVIVTFEPLKKLNTARRYCRRCVWIFGRVHVFAVSLNMFPPGIPPGTAHFVSIRNFPLKNAKTLFRAPSPLPQETTGGTRSEQNDAPVRLG